MPFEGQQNQVISRSFLSCTNDGFFAGRRPFTELLWLQLPGAIKDGRSSLLRHPARALNRIDTGKLRLLVSFHGSEPDYRPVWHAWCTTFITLFGLTESFSAC